MKYLKQSGVSLAICAMLLAASNFANAQGRRGRGEERRQENQAAREQRQQERQQVQQNRRRLVRTRLLQTEVERHGASLSRWYGRRRSRDRWARDAGSGVDLRLVEALVREEFIDNGIELGAVLSQ